MRCFMVRGRAINAATRAGAQRFTVREPVASTSTPSPGPSTTPRPARRATLHASIDDENRGLAFRGIHCPFGTAHRRNRLRGDDLEVISTRLFGYLKQQGLAAQLDRIRAAVAIAVHERKPRAALRDNRHAPFTTQGLQAVAEICGEQPILAGCAAAVSIAKNKQRTA